MSSINGIGTRYLGCSDVRRDGSYVTTKWLSIVLPVVPLCSFRVLPLSQTTRYLPVYYVSSEFDAKPVPLCWLQVVQVYAWYLAVALFLLVADRLGGHNSIHSGSLHPLLSSFLAFALAVVALRISRPIRKAGTLTNIIVILAVMTLSLLLAPKISAMPEVSWNYMYYFWAGYAVFLVIMFLKGGSPSDRNDT